MTVSRFYAWLVLGAAVCTLAAANPHRHHESAISDVCSNQLCDTGVPGYTPLGQAGIDGLVQRGSSPEIREHAWNLFRAMAVDPEKPVWLNWSPKCSVLGASGGCPPAATTAPTPRLLLLGGMTTPAQTLAADSNDRDRFAEVMYNPAAAAQIRAFLQQQGKTSALGALTQASGSASPTSSPKFDSSAIAVKTIWELIAPDDLGLSTVPNVIVWDPRRRTLNHSAANTLSPAQSWHSTVTVDLKSTSPCQVNQDYSHGTVPLDCFYSETINMDEAEKVMQGDPATKALFAARVVDPRLVFHLVLLGFHVMTRESENWTWQTFYWSSRGFPCSGQTPCKGDPYQAGNPAGTAHKPMWSHYVMRTTLDDLTPPGDENVFNPYLEGPSPGGMVSNCMRCHRQAVFHTQDRFIEGIQLGGDISCANATIPCKARGNYPQSGVGTSFIWSLADTNHAIAGGGPTTASATTVANGTARHAQAAPTTLAEALLRRLKTKPDHSH